MQSTEAVVNNPFALMLNPDQVFQAIERSGRLERLQRRICRPLDKPVLSRTPSDLSDFEQAIASLQAQKELLEKQTVEAKVEIERRQSKAKAELDEVRAHHGSVWAEFKDDPDYHKKAFKAAMVARAMDATTRAEFFRMREQYENELGLHDQLPLPLSDVNPAA